MNGTPRADRLILAITADRIRYLLETQPAGMGEDTRTGLDAVLLCLEADVAALDGAA